MNESGPSVKQILDQAKQCVAAGRLDDAERLFEQLCTGPSAAEGHHGRGVVAAFRQDFASAARHFERACELEPGNAMFHYQRGVGMLSTRRPEPAASAFERCVELDPGFGQAWYNLGAARQQMGRLDGAVDAFRRSATATRSVEIGRLAAISAIRSAGAIDAAIEEARAALAVREEWPEAWAQLAICLAGRQDLETAITCWERALELNPSLHEARFQLGIALGGLARLDEAAQAYRRLLDHQPNHVGALVNLAGILMRQERLDDAERLLTTASNAAGPERSVVLRALGDLRLRQGRPAEASQVFRQAASLAPQDPRAELGVIRSLIEQDRRDEALAEAERLSGRFPQVVEVTEAHCECLIEAGRGAQAISAIDACIARHGGSAVRLALRGRACESVGDLDSARRDFKAALQLSPTLEVALEGLTRVGR